MALDQIEPYFDNPASLDHETEEWVNALAVLIDEYEERAGFEIGYINAFAIDVIRISSIRNLVVSSQRISFSFRKKTQFVQDIL